MSEFLHVKTDIKAEHKSCFIQALEDANPYWRGHIEVYEGKGELLKTYLAKDQRGQRANIIIRRQYVGPASNDIGFTILPDGTLDSVISDYDRGHKDEHGDYTGRYGTAWMNKNMMEYSVRVAEKQAMELDMDMEKTVNEDGTYHVEMYPRGAGQHLTTRTW